MVHDVGSLRSPAHRRVLGRVITSGGRLVGTLVGTRGAVGSVVGRSVGTGGVFGVFGVFAPALALASGGGGVTITGAAGGIFVAGLNAFVVWQSAHVVGNVECPGYVLDSYSGR
ncbi:MAG: hypothetical protein JWO86_2098 [Myxococcaceae bacterium]|nr:hypothetical protein [Myxococcaceae bacterium]